MMRSTTWQTHSSNLWISQNSLRRSVKAPHACITGCKRLSHRRRRVYPSSTAVATPMDGAASGVQVIHAFEIQFLMKRGTRTC